MNPMDYSDALKITLTALASLGGGGLIVRSMSGYLGRMWADRALEHQKHEYNRLNIQFQNQLDEASRRLQVELDSLSLVHKLRTQEEFARLAGLWKRVVAVRTYYAVIAQTGLRIMSADKDKQKQYDAQTRSTFEASLIDAQIFLNEGMLFIPKHISDIAGRALNAALEERLNFVFFAPYLETPTIPMPSDLSSETAKVRQEYYKSVAESFKRFNGSTNEFETSMRDHIAGKGKPA